MDWDIRELACKVLVRDGKSEDEIEAIISTDRLDDLLDEEYGIDIETYRHIVRDLLPFTPAVGLVLGGDQYHAFVADGVMIVKEKISGKSGT